MVGQILIVEDDTTFRSLLTAILEDEGHSVVQAASGTEAMGHLARTTFDLILSDLNMPGMSGLEFYRHTRQDPSAPPFVVITAFGTIEEAVAALKEGVSDFLTKPLKDPAMLRTLVDGLLEESRNRRRFQALELADQSGLPPGEILFAGAAMAEVKRLLSEVTATEATVLITGESGTGKEVLARMLHLSGKRRTGPFVAVNCAAIPETLIESELFGHERGAFTGATQTRQGKFEAAAGGTLLLDEIGEMPFSMQAKLLRVLQERTFQRVGGNRDIRTDVRIVAATNRNLAKEVGEGRFREDLFYRLNVFPLSLPPLRDRYDAIDDLASYFASLHGRAMGKRINGLSAAALKALRDYDWPGNIRELQNVMERAVILAHGVITPVELPEGIRVFHYRDDGVEDGVLKDAERSAIIKTLAAVGGNRRLAAERLGISRRTLQYRLKEFGLLDSGA